MECKICGKKSHYCSSCSDDMYMHHGYCSKKCYESSDEYKTFSKSIEEFWNSLTDNQKFDLWALWDNGIFFDDKFENFLDNLIKDPYENES